jgi:hypothetical protein
MLLQTWSRKEDSVSEVEFVGPYDRDKCHFCGKSDKTHPTETSRNVAGFGRVENGETYDACEKCAKEVKFLKEEAA